MNEKEIAWKLWDGGWGGGRVNEEEDRPYFFLYVRKMPIFDNQIKLAQQNELCWQNLLKVNEKEIRGKVRGGGGGRGGYRGSRRDPQHRD